MPLPEEKPQEAKPEEKKNLTFEEIVEQSRDYNQRQADFVNQSMLRVREYEIGGGKDDLRYANKEMLKDVVREYTNRTQNDEVEQLLGEIQKYAGMDVTATLSTGVEFKDDMQYHVALKARVDEEIKQFEKIYKSSGELRDRLEKQVLEAGPDEMNTPQYKQLEDEYRMVNQVFMYFEGQRSGQLEPTPADAHHINTHGKEVRTPTITYTDERGRERKGNPYEKKVDDMPLFAHDPSYNDLRQGGMGDCYLLSGLSQLAMTHPEKIKEMIRENDDQTVTVRFYKRTFDPEKGPGVNDKYEPVFVTVDKIVMDNDRYQGAQFNLWAQMIERAYAASGLNVPGKLSDGARNLAMSKYADAVPDNIDELYEKYSHMSPTELPTHEECPWLIDETGNLHKFDRSYDTIDGGDPGQFLEHCLGEGFRKELRSTARMNTYDPPANKYQHFSRLVFDVWAQHAPEMSKEELAAEKERFIADLFSDGFNHMIDVTRKTFYEAVTGEKAPVENGVYKAKDGRSAAIARMCFDVFSEFQNAYDEKHGVGKDLDTSDIIERVLNAYSDDTMELVPGEGARIAQYRNAIRTGQVSPTGNSDLLEIRDLFRKASTNVREEIEGGPAFSGKYNGAQEKLFDEMKQALADKKPIIAGTYDKTEKKVMEGLFGGHAYAVTGTRVDPNTNVRYVKVRNPYGQDGMKYVDSGYGFIMSQKDPAAPGGEFEVELSDFVSNFERVEMNIGSKETEKAPSRDTYDVQAARAYGKQVQGMLSELVATDDGGAKAKTSREYSEFESALKEFRSYTAGAASKDFKDIVEHPSYQTLKEKSEAYLKHCEGDSKWFSSRRNTRMRVAQSVTNLMNNFENKTRDPKQATLDGISERIMTTYGKSLMATNDKAAQARGRMILNDPGYMQKMSQKFQDTLVFKKAFEGRSFSEISKAAARSDKELFKPFMKTVMQLKLPEQANLAKEKVNEAPNMAKETKQVESSPSLV